jgi:hypothetical protein
MEAKIDGIKNKMNDFYLPISRRSFFLSFPPLPIQINSFYQKFLAETVATLE